MVAQPRQNKKKLFTAFGVPIFADASALLLVAFVVMFYGSGGPQGIINAILLAVLIMASVAAHEVGHAVAIRRLGYGTSTIILSGLGGVTQWRGRATHKHRILIAIAGPIVSLVLGLGFIGAYIGIGGAEGAPWPIPFLLQMLGILNLIWAVFNMLPVWPMDGGKVLRSAVAMKKGDYQAVKISLIVSMAVAGIVGAIGFVIGQWFIAVLLAWILVQNYQEWQQFKRL